MLRMALSVCQAETPKGTLYSISPGRMLIRRPVVIAGRRVVFGFDKTRLGQLVKSAR